MKSDGALLRDYGETRSEDAFAELVRRHLDLVYSTALRQVNGDVPLAQDVAQTVFTDLARKAGSLSGRSVLTGWLYTSTHFAAAKAVRTERRRQAHEQEAQAMRELLHDPAPDPDWDRLRPVLDAAMLELQEADREAVLLRYFERRPHAEIGAKLGVSENTARMRVERALDKLRAHLAGRGATTTAAALSAAISANAIQTAPASLGAAITAALAETTLTTAATATAAKAIAMTALQKTLLAATLVATLSTGLYEARQASRWRTQVQTLEQQQALLAGQIAQLQSDNENLSNRIAKASQSPSLSSERLRELLRLRGEVGMLKRQQRELEQAAAEAQSKTRSLSGQATSVAAPPSAMPAPFQMQLVLDGPGENTETMTNASNARGEALHVLKTPLLDHTAIRSAAVTTDVFSGNPRIDIEFSDVGKELFAAVTKENISKRLAIVIDGRLISAPVIQSEIPGGKAQITGSFTEEEARALAAKINDAIGGKN